jgi:transposase
MRDVELYQQILGLSAPWTVDGVALDVEAQRVDVCVVHAADARWWCPHCERELPVYDHSEERTWRHLDTCQFATYLRGRLPRVDCPEHGVVQVDAPWAEPRGRFTILFERFAIDVLLQCQTVQGACRLLGISWDQARAVMDRAVARGQQRKQATPVPRIGVDEKAFRKGHVYMTVVCDLDRSVVEYVTEDRTKESLHRYFSSRTPEQMRAFEAIAMDMWEPYVQATREAVPLAHDKIVFDRFHIMQHMTEAVDDVRKQEHRALSKDGDESLKGTKYLWLTNQENLSEKRRDELASLPVRVLETGRAWAIKELLRDLWHHATPAAAGRFFEGWYSWAIRSRLEPVKDVARMIKTRVENVVNYCRHWITNAVSEGLNSKIMSLKRRAGGYRNPDSFKTAIYFHCGGLDLYPR